MNDIMNYAMYIYPAKTQDGIQWNVEFPEVFGVGGAGNTLEEAINEAQENLKIHLKFLTDENLEKTPNLRILKDIINNTIEDLYDKLNTYIRDLRADRDYIDDFDYGYNCALDKLVSFIEQLKQLKYLKIITDEVNND